MNTYKEPYGIGQIMTNKLISNNIKTYDACYDCMRDYLVGKGFKEISPYVFEETKELVEAVLTAPDYAREGAGTWGKKLDTYFVTIELTKSEKDRLVNYCKKHNLEQKDAVKGAIMAVV